MDVDAEHTERQVKRYEQERDEWEKKYEVRSIRHRWRGTIGNHKINPSYITYRKQRRGTARHKQSSTSSLLTWTTSEDLRLITVTTHSSPCVVSIQVIALLYSQSINGALRPYVVLPC